MTAPPQPGRIDRHGSTPALRAALGVLGLFVGGHAVVALTAPSAGEPVCSAPSCLPLRIDPNFASGDDLVLLPGVGPKIADNIIAYRQQFPPGTAFRVAEDLDKVAHIGPALVAKLRAHLCFGPASESQPAPAGEP